MWTYEQNFDSLSTGNLAGQDSWTYVSGNQPQVQGSVFVSTPYGISADLNANVNTYRDITPVTTDGSTCYVSLRVTHTSSFDNWGLRFQQGGTWLGTLYMNDNSPGDINFRTGLSPFGRTTLLTGAAANTWYRLGIEFDFTNDRARVSLDNGGWSGWVSIPSCTQVDRIVLEGNNGDGTSVTGYMDDISASYAEATAVQPGFFSFL